MLIQLIPIGKIHLELIRNWRNQQHIRNVMEFKSIISEAQQKAWFESLDHRKDRYFIFAFRDELVGLTHLKNCTQDSAEAGLFVGNEKFIGTGVAFHASLALLDLAFFELKLKKVIAKVHRDNVDAIQYNASLGFIKVAAINNEFIRMELIEDSYSITRQKLSKALNTVR